MLFTCAIKSLSLQVPQCPYLSLPLFFLSFFSSRLPWGWRYTSIISSILSTYYYKEDSIVCWCPNVFTWASSRSFPPPSSPRVSPENKDAIQFFYQHPLYMIVRKLCVVCRFSNGFTWASAFHPPFFPSHLPWGWRCGSMLLSTFGMYGTDEGKRCMDSVSLLRKGWA